MSTTILLQANMEATPLPPLRFMESNRGGAIIVIDDYIFQNYHRVGGSTYFLCSNKPKRCNAGLTLYGFDPKKLTYASYRLKETPHNHEPNPNLIAKREKNEARRKRTKLVNRKTGEVIQDFGGIVKEPSQVIHGRRKLEDGKESQVNDEFFSSSIKVEMEEEPPTPLTFEDNGFDETSPPSPMEDFVEKVREPTAEMFKSCLSRCLVCSSLQNIKNGGAEATLRLPAFLGCDSGSKSGAERWSAFFLRGVLQFSREQCGNIVKQLKVINSQSYWWFILCPVCSEIMENIYNIHERMLRMENEMKLLQKGVEEKMKTSLEEKVRRAGGGPLEGKEDLARVQKVFRMCLHKVSSIDKDTLQEILQDRLGLGKNFSSIPIPTSAIQNDTSRASNIRAAAPNRTKDDTSNFPTEMMLDAMDDDDQYSCSEAGGPQSDQDGLWKPEDDQIPIEKPELRRSSRHSEQQPDLKEDSEEEETDSSEDDSDPAYEPQKSFRSRSHAKTTCSSQRQPVKLNTTATNLASKTAQIKSKYKARRRQTKRTISKNKKLPSSNKPSIGKCPICPRRFKNNEDRLQHKIDHETLTDFVCKICNFPAISLKGLNIHIGARHEKGIRSTCEKCGYVMLTGRSRRRHLEVHRVNDTIVENPAPDGGYLCQLCSEVFYNKDKARTHLGERHREQLGIKLFICETCGKQSMNASTHNNHIKLVHEGQRNFACEECDSRFESRRKLENHKWKHKPPGQNTVICDICGLEYGSPGGLEDHLKKFHERKWGSRVRTSQAPEKECPHCGVQCVHEKALSLHMQTKHPELFHFACDLCDAKFAKEGSLRNHKLGVHGTGQFNCPNCESVFKCDDYMKRHLRVNCRNNPGSRYCRRKQALLEMERAAQGEILQETTAQIPNASSFHVEN